MRQCFPRDGINLQNRIVAQCTHHSPKDALQFQDGLLAVALEAVFTNKLSELGEVAFLLKNLAAKIRFGHHTVEMRRYVAIVEAVEVLG